MMNEVFVNDENPEVQNIDRLGGSVPLEVKKTKILPPVLDFNTFPADNTASVLLNHATMLALSLSEQKKAMQNVEDECCIGSTVKKSGSMQDVASGFKLADGNAKVSDTISSICRTQSYHSIAQALPRSDGVELRAGVRKAASSHAVQGTQLGARSSAPVITTVAFNAELLAAFERERRILDRRISELTQIAEFRRLEIERLKIELRQRDEHDIGDEDQELSSHQKSQSQELPANLNINVEHFTDSEKLSLLQVGRLSGDRNSCSLDSQKFRVVSDGGESYSRETDYELALSTASMDANWDYASEGAATTGSGSEVSVACLQDRLLAMEETQYSTNEELAATLQELADLQDTVNVLTSENEQLADERAILLESLCTQTQKLENTRRQVENLKALVFRDCDGMEVRSEKETQLVALLHCAEEEREELRLKQTELSNTVSGLSAEKQTLQQMISMLSNQTNGLESQLCAIIAEKKVLEANLAGMKGGGHIDCGLTQNSPFLTDELKPAKPVDSPEKECQQCLCFERLLGTVRSELASVCDEKNALVEKIQQLEQESNEQRILIIEYENDLKAAACKLETAELESVEAHNALHKLHVSSAQIAEEQKAVIRRLEAELQLANTRASEAAQQIAEITLRHDLESAEWINFQRDLQTAVRVAVEVRNESQEQVELLQAEKRALIEKEVLLNHEIDSMHAELSRLRAVQPSIVETKSTIRDCVMNTVDRELTLLRQQGRRISDGTVGPCDNVESMQTGSKPSLSVRHLIASIEEQLKADSSSPFSGRFDLHQAKLGNIVQTSGESVLKCASKPLSLSLSPVLNRSLCMSSAHEMNSDSSVFSDPQIMDGMLMAATDETKCAVAELTVGTLPTVDKICRDDAVLGQRKPVSGILANKSQKKKICSSIIDSDNIDNKVGGLSTVMANHSLSKTVTADPLSALAKQLGGSKRNALLKWCQNRTATYTGIDVTNFSSSWNDGLAFCALLHTYLPNQIPYKDLTSEDKKYNFTLAFKAAESVGISTTLNMNDMLATERPDWQAVMTYITSIYRHFEMECRS